MDQRADNRVQCAGDGEHDGDEVERERECYIELDGAHHALGERDEVRQLLDLVVDERDIRAVHGGVGDGAALRELDNSGLSGLFGNGDVVLGKELCVAREEGLPSTRAETPRPGTIWKFSASPSASPVSC